MKQPPLPMDKDEKNRTAAMPRREFLRGAAGGALALATGQLLAGCSGGTTADEIRGAMNPQTRLFVSTFLHRTIEVLNAGTGNPVGRLAQFTEDPPLGNAPFPALNQRNTTAGLTPLPNGDLLMFSPGGNAFLQYDLATGALKRTIAGVITPHTGAIGPDGLLYVANAPSLNGFLGVGPDTIEVYNPNTGEQLGPFAEVRSPFGVLWGPDGDLYVSTALAYLPFPAKCDYVVRLDGKTGQERGVVAREVKVPFSMAFHPNGNLLVVEHFDSRVLMVDVSNGHKIDAFVSVPFPVGIAYGPDGDFYAASFTDSLDNILKIFDNDFEGAKGTGSVQRFDGITGKPKGTVLSNMPFAGFLAFA